MASCNHVDPDRRLCPDRRLQERGAGRARRIDRLAVLAAFRFGSVLCRAAWHARSRPLAGRAAGAGPRHAALPAKHAHSRNPFRDRGRRRHLGRFHAVPQRAFRDRAPRRRHARQAENAHRAHPAFRLRRRGAVGDPAGKRRAARDRRSRHGGAAHAGARHGQGHDHGRRVRHRRGRNHSVRPDLFALAQDFAGNARPDHGAAGDRKSSGPNGRQYAGRPANGRTRCAAR